MHKDYHVPEEWEELTEVQKQELREALQEVLDDVNECCSDLIMISEKIVAAMSEDLLALQELLEDLKGGEE